MFGCFSSEKEFIDFLRFLDNLCSSGSHEAEIGSNKKIRFRYNVLESSLGILDVFRYQAEENWGIKESPYSAQIGQGLFDHQGNKIVVNDRADLGWKYYLPDPTPFFCVNPQPELIPKLIDIVSAVGTSKNISSNYIWEGP